MKWIQRDVSRRCDRAAVAPPGDLHAGSGRMELEEQIVLEEEMDENYEPTEQGESADTSPRARSGWRVARAPPGHRP